MTHSIRNLVKALMGPRSISSGYVLESVGDESSGMSVPESLAGQRSFSVADRCYFPAKRLDARSRLTSGYDFFGSLASGLVFSDCAAFPIAKKINAMYRPMEM